MFYFNSNFFHDYETSTSEMYVPQKIKWICYIFHLLKRKRCLLTYCLKSIGHFTSLRASVPSSKVRNWDHHDFFHKPLKLPLFKHNSCWNQTPNLNHCFSCPRQKKSLIFLTFPPTGFFCSSLSPLFVHVEFVYVSPTSRVYTDPFFFSLLLRSVLDGTLNSELKEQKEE